MTTNEKQSLLVKVTLGVVCDYGTRTNQELKMPPPLPNPQNHVNLSNPSYDSVSGITSNTRVYMTYDKCKSYPIYILKYTCSSSQ